MLFTTGVRAEKSSENDKWTTYGNVLWNRSKVAGINTTTSNAMWGGLRYDRNITKRVFAFGAFDFERDRPQLLNMRTVFGGGLGVHAIKNDRTELDLFSGLAYNRTWFVGPNKNSAELLVGNTFKHKFNDRVKFQQGFTLYPNLSDGGEYRFVFDSTLSADITKRIGWFVTIGDRFNSLPVIGAEKNDFLFATGLKVGFGKKK
jgi:putative salt-induced outer membrane protein YdiY